ncbi:MAG: acyl--CoA ligase [Syntrophales bacterium]|nr:acyl--CoA ligase [Syntrophales bacterium]MDD4338384.1 class I adenylate-forming enzyme family protein [Syntrophales bacterium]
MGWQDLNLTWHYVEKWAQEKPGAEALVFGDERLSWKDFKDRMDRIARAYLAIGVEKGDRIALLSAARNEFLLTYMAAGKVGGMWLGLNPKFTLDELRYQIGDSKPVVLIAVRTFLGNDLAATIAALKEEFPFIKRVLVIGDPVEGTENFQDFIDRPRPELDAAMEKRAADIRPGDDALLMYTSGSTGKPKGVVHTHGSIVENIKVEVVKFYVDEETRCLLHFPINHVAADVEIGFAAVMAGGCLVFMEQFDPVGALKTIEKETITMFGQVPVMFLLQMKQPEFFQTDFSHVRLMAWAGAAAPKIMIDVLSGICAKTGGMMITGYGSTEVCGFVTYTEKGDDPNTLLKTAGKIAPPFELKIVDDDRRELPDGQIGEIAVRGPFMFKGYLNNSEATAEVLDRNGWYYTSDLAFKDARGYITITGRKSEMFKTGGENVYPREIEEIIETHPSVLFAAVMGVPDEIYQEVGWAFVMPSPGKEVTEEELRELCRSKLANFKVPKKFFVRPLLPLLASGKVSKLALKEEIKGLLKS